MYQTDATKEITRLPESRTRRPTKPTFFAQSSRERCLNCSLRLTHLRRRTLQDATEPMMDILRTWISPTPISRENRLCVECFEMLRQLPEGEAAPLPMFGHRSVCFACGTSTLRGRTHVVPPNCPQTNTIIGWTFPHLVPRLTTVCIACWTAANRKNIQKKKKIYANVDVDIFIEEIDDGKAPHTPVSQLRAEECVRKNDRSVTPAPATPLQQCDPEENSIDYEEILACAECGVDIGAREMYRCVQCPLLLMCAKCGGDNKHAYHCVLRMPSVLVYNKMRHLFEHFPYVFNSKLCDCDDVNCTTATVKSGRRDDEVRAIAKEKSLCRKPNESEDVKITKTRTEAVAVSLSRELPAIAAETSGEPLIYPPEVKPEPDPDPLSCPLDPDPLTLSALDLFSASYRSKPKKRKALDPTTPPIKNPGIKSINEMVEQDDDEDVDVEVEDYEPKETVEMEVKQEPPDQHSQSLPSENKSNYKLLKPFLWR